MDKIGFIKKDIYNLECSVNGKLRNHDVQLVTEYFMAEQKKNEAFYFKIEGDGEDRFSRCFWADATSRRAYRFYGDVVVCDTTFNTNRYDLTFAPILGVYNHGQTIVLACTFFSKETTESFIWMFEEFKKAMPGGEPKTIITDQDAAMTRAISIAFPTTFHRLCIWHITSKFPVKLPHSAYKEYWREFQKAIWDTNNKDEFDAKWNIVVTKAELKTEDASKVVFNVSERKNWQTRVAEVVYVKDSDHASCSCKRFEFVGIICKHIQALFRRDQIEYMPDKYILNRWKKTAKAGLVSDANGNEIKHCADPGLLIKRSTMSRLASDVVEDALMCEEGCELVSETLKSLRVKLKLLKDGPSNNEVGGSSSQTQYMKDPKRERCKGRSKRVTGAKEKAMKRGIRHCQECGDIGHDIRQCPRNLNTP
ncbi:protein FAR1-RELATED SEQUENCE 5-like [Prunus avium]|uniref:Protein FAR1-RELATED SEQUENCE 5-like n=1 Tax=Prunus avium TaxID=42229 RepID=A0A6P5U5L6_PRUAV|nr:protein FAR1-RELATED SEQUENCE 5-like [Prunus avium]